ncbi:MAG: hypothetical protein M1320_00405 [Patescibacteria group bacterium]|nr:hypothetical protein [Patescibacteria group bacterium]
MHDPAQKKIFVVFVIVVCCFVAYWVIAFGIPHPNSSGSVTTLNSSSSTPAFFNENALGSLRVVNFSTTSTPNLTQSLIQDVSQEVNVSLQTASSTSKEDLLQAIQKSGVTNLDATTLQKYASPDKLGLIQSIPDTLIRIDTSSSTQAIINYKNAFMTATAPLSSFITATSSLDDVFNSFMKDGDATKLDNLIQTYQNIYTELQSISVPSRVVLLHKNALQFFYNGAIIFMGIRDYQNDPLKAYILSSQAGDLSTLWGQIVDQFKIL